MVFSLPLLYNKLMENMPSSRENIIPFEIKIGEETTKETVAKNFLNRKITLFLCTKNGDFYLSEQPHASIKRRNGLDWEDVITRGFVRLLKTGKIDIQYEDYSSDEVKKNVVAVMEKTKELFSDYE